MDRYTGAAHSLLRVFAAASFFTHGAVKLFGWFGGMPPGAALTPLTLAAGLIEVVAGTLVCVGLFTRPAAFIASGEMAVAYFKSHFPRGFWPIENRGEPALLFCFVFLFIAAAGAGPLSLDRLLRRRRESPVRRDEARERSAASG